MPLSTTELNRVADDIVSSELKARVHTGDPGSNGTSSRIGTIEATMAAASWSAASDGDVQYDADLEFGVLDADTARTVTWISIWRGAAFVSRHELSAAVAVTVGGTFKVNTGTVDLNGSTT